MGILDGKITAEDKRLIEAEKFVRDNFNEMITSDSPEAELLYELRERIIMKQANLIARPEEKEQIENGFRSLFTMRIASYLLKANGYKGDI